MPQHIITERNGRTIYPPIESDTPHEVISAISSALTEEQKNERCVCAIWEGYKGPTVGRFGDAGAALVSGIGTQEYYLLRCNLGEGLNAWKASLIERDDSEGFVPQAMWPLSQEWYFSVPFNWSPSFFGGPRSLVSQVLADNSFEAYEVTSDYAWPRPKIMSP